MGIAIDWTVSVGNLLAIFAIVGTAIAAWFGLKQFIAVLGLRMDTAERRMDGIDARLSDIVTILKQQAVAEERMNQFRRELDDMKHGHGFVFNLGTNPHEVPPRR